MLDRYIIRIVDLAYWVKGAFLISRIIKIKSCNYFHNLISNTIFALRPIVRTLSERNLEWTSQPFSCTKFLRIMSTFLWFFSILLHGLDKNEQSKLIIHLDLIFVIVWKRITKTWTLSYIDIWKKVVHCWLGCPFNKFSLLLFTHPIIFS